ncbi:MAG: transposase family protein [Rubrivivax sp.]|nr:transposase family protein [Rubrivivax sp.]
MSASNHASVHERWAHLRFSVIGHLLAAPPPKGELRAELRKLAQRTWRHPVTGAPARFAVSTIERWLLRARRERRDPVAVLRRKVRADAGVQKVGPAIRQALQAQYGAHPSWSVQLHADNLRALIERDPALGPAPSYSSVRRLFQAQGWRKRQRLSSRDTAGAQLAEARLAAREVRSYEAPYVGSLWHWDCHVGSRPVLTAAGQWATPVLFGVLDDFSRLGCHLQWYLRENAECVAHGLSQAIHKRGLPRAAMSDNGAAMLAAEITEGLARLGIVHETTLAYSPYMNGKIEHLWANVEGRLMAMLEGVADLTLATLNEATQAWCEYEYNRTVHSETGATPLARWLAGPEVLRPSPDSEALRLAFTRTEKRTQRHSDGTLVLEARRFEVPNRYRHLRELHVRYAAWDLARVHLLDERSGQILCRLYPQDKQANARGVRRPLEPIGLAGAGGAAARQAAPGQMAPLLEGLMAKQAATGLPPAYLTKDEPPAPQGEQP